MKKLFVPIYKAPIYFLSNCSEKEAKKQFKPYGFDTEWREGAMGKTIATYFEDDGTIIYGLWIREIRDLSYLVHEVCHLANFILQDRRIVIYPENDEAFAYLVEYLFKELRKKTIELPLLQGKKIKFVKKLK